MAQDVELMYETIETANAFIGSMLQNIVIISSDIQSGREDRGLNLFIDFIDAMKWLIDVMHLTKPLQENAGQTIDIGEGNDVFRQIVEAFENRDYILLSDLLEYEVTPVLSQWEKKLTLILRDRIN